MKSTLIAMKTGLRIDSYMSEQHLMYFKNRLICQKADMMNRMAAAREKIQSLKERPADILDRSTHAMALEQEIRNCERYSRVIRQIDEAMERISNGSFGYCEYTGLPIGLERLNAMPFASLSIEALEELETGSFY